MKLHRTSIDSPAKSLSFSANSGWMVSVLERHCYVWDFSSPDKPSRTALHNSVESRITMAKFGPMGSSSAILATRSEDDSIRLWDAQSGIAQLLYQFRGMRVLDIAFLYDYKIWLLSAVGDGSVVEVRDPESRESVARPVSGQRHRATVHAACFSQGREYVASVSEDGVVKLWRTEDGSCLARFGEHSGKVEHVVFSPSARTLSSGAYDGTVCIRRLHDGQ